MSGSISQTQGRTQIITRRERIDWIAQVRAQGVAYLAREVFGLQYVPKPEPGSIACPACGAIKRGSTDRRGAAGLTRNGLGWHCHRCSEKGDAVSLAAWAITGSRVVAGDQRWSELIWPECAARGLCDPPPNRPLLAPRPRRVPPPPAPPAPPLRPPQAEVQALWDASVAVSADVRVRDYLAHRSLDPAQIQPDTARALPLTYAWPKWWPPEWTSTWRLVVPAYDPTGKLVSLHARAITDPDAKPKTRWPKYVESSGLLMADWAGVAVLRGELTDIEAIVVVEGLTDLLAASARITRKGQVRAVFSVTSGCAKALADVRWPKGVSCFVETDNDKPGDAYAQEVRDALPPAIEVKRVRLGAVHV